MSIETIQTKIEKQRAVLADLQAQLTAEQNKKPDEAIAEQLHGMLCNSNHTDGCGWEYEFKDGAPEWYGNTHSRYLEKARKMIRLCQKEEIDPERAMKIFRLVNSL